MHIALQINSIEVEVEEFSLTWVGGISEKLRKVNFPSHDRVCDDRIRHLNHLQ